MSATAKLLTVEEYTRLPDNGKPTELVRGRVVSMEPPFPRHGQICSEAVRSLYDFIHEHELGHLVAYSGVPTEHDPDTVRGADVAFYSYVKVPKGPLPDSYLPVPPDLIVEVRSADEPWKNLLMKVAEYLNAGVAVVCVLDEAPPVIYVFTPDTPVRVLESTDEWTLPDLLPGFSIEVRRLFE